MEGFSEIGVTVASVVAAHGGKMLLKELPAAYEKFAGKSLGAVNLENILAKNTITNCSLTKNAAGEMQLELKRSRKEAEDVFDAYRSGEFDADYSLILKEFCRKNKLVTPTLDLSARLNTSSRQFEYTCDILFDDFRFQPPEGTAAAEMPVLAMLKAARGCLNHLRECLEGADKEAADKISFLQNGVVHQGIHNIRYGKHKLE